MVQTMAPTVLASLLAAALLGAASFPLFVLANPDRRQAQRRALLVFVVSWPLAFLLHWRTLETEPTDRPVQVVDGGYMTSDACRSCHPSHYETWRNTYHSTMTQVASPQSVIPRFENQEIEVEGRRYRLLREGDDFFVEMDDPREPGLGRRVTRQIVLTTGSHIQQIFWYSSGQDRRMAHLPIAYLIDEERWIPRLSAFLTVIPSTEEKYAYIGEGAWNVTCLACHTTRSRPKVLASSFVDTDFVELGIACEACHGPGLDHIRANQNPLRRYSQYSRDEPDETVVQAEFLPHELASQPCGQCHGIARRRNHAHQRWNEWGASYVPGDDLRDFRILISPRNRTNPEVRQILRDPSFAPEDSYWSDGMVRVGGREFNGLIDSPCYQRGELACMSCHVLHQEPDDPRPPKEWANHLMKSDMGGDEGCLQCHTGIADRVAQHSRHTVGSSGSRCYNCHMPYTTYGLLKAIRSHTIDSPTVRESLDTGRPNACNLCHLDRTLAWSATHLERWYGQPRPELTEDEQQVAASLLWMLRGDAGQRALAAWAMGWPPAQEASGSDWMGPFVAQLLDDPYDAVRFIAARSLRGLAGYEGFPYDFIDPPAKRAKAPERAVTAWRSGRDGARIWRAETLLESDGSLMRDQLERLLAQRDDHRVNLNE
ncbi:MAG: multiheme c-type cytochrome [Myxococcota bacterium]